MRLEQALPLTMRAKPGAAKGTLADADRESGTSQVRTTGRKSKVRHVSRFRLADHSTCGDGKSAAAECWCTAALPNPRPTPRASTFGRAAAARDIEAIFGNPALVGVAVGTVAAFGRFEAATHVTLASSSSLGPFSIGIGAQYLDYVRQTIGPR